MANGSGIVARVADGWRSVLAVLLALLGIGVIAGLVLTLGNATRQRDVALRAQAHSYDVMLLARTLDGTIASAEAMLGRFVISGDKQIGRVFAEEWRTAGDQIDRLRRLTASDGVQQRQIEILDRLYRARGDELNAIALRTYYAQNMGALSRYYEAGSSPNLRRIDRMLDRTIGIERRLLNRRTAAAAASVERASRIAGVLAAFGLVLAIALAGLGWAAVNAVTARRVARQDADAEAHRADELESAVAAATEELRHAMAALQAEAHDREQAEARLRQGQKMEAVGQLTGGIAHDFNNMLAVVVGGLELAQRRLAAGDPRVERHLDNALEGANRAAALTRRLLAFARAEALLPEAVAPAELIDGMSDLLDRTLGERITVATGSSGEAWRIWVDRHQLENAILNLAVNARDAMEGSGALHIATGSATVAAGAGLDVAPGDYCTICVADTGCGMTAEVMERVFEPFFTTKPVGMGTGLGLSQIFGFVQQSGGGVAIRSAPGEGTAVTVYLPRHHGETIAAVSERAGDEAAVAGAARQLCVLVVEDDARVLGATMAALRELGHRPVACGDPGEVVRCLDDAAATDLILTDVVMPGINGPEMIAALPDRHRTLPVLFVTGFTGEASDGAIFGGHPVLRKPFTLARLAAAIAEAAPVAAPPAALAAE